MEYLLNEKQKQFMQQMHEMNERKLEEEKAEKYKVDDLFKRNVTKQEEQKNEEVVQETALVEYKESFFAKIVNKIKSFFKR